MGTTAPAFVWRNVAGLSWPRISRSGATLRLPTNADGFVKSFKGRFAPSASTSICSSASTRPASHRGLKDRLQHQPLANVFTGSYQLSCNLSQRADSARKSSESRINFANRISRFAKAMRHGGRRAVAFKLVGENIFIAKSRDSESVLISISPSLRLVTMRAAHLSLIC